MNKILLGQAIMSTYFADFGLCDLSFTPRRKYAKPIQSEASIKLAKERAEAKRKRKAEKRLANR